MAWHPIRGKVISLWRDCESLVDPLAGKDLETNVTSGARSGEEALVQRLAHSRTLGRAPRLRELLLDIVAHARQPELLTEQQIGIRVFGRSEGYNPADDNIVRAAARQLRVKLKEYFDGEGLDEAVILDIPKGGYLPVFSPRAVVPAGSTRRLPLLWIGLAAGLLAVIAALLVERARLRASSAEPDTLFAAFLGQTTGPVRFVLTDSALSVQNALIPTPPDVEAYSTRSFIAEGERRFSSNPALLDAWKTLAGRQITSLADVGVLVRLLQTHPAAGRRIEIRHAKHMRTRDFKAGHLIITGSQMSNPWAALFDQSLNFAFERQRIVNRRPRPGELSEYRLSAPGQHWAHIVLTRNLSSSGWVLLAAGLGFEGTEGAGEFLLDPEAPGQVRKLLGLAPQEPLPAFELLLEIAAMEGTARSSRVVAWRRY